jgi:hypothetical protein
MKISLRLAELLGTDAKTRGVLSRIEDECKVDRHTITSWLNNTALYVSLDALGRVADYLVRHGADKDLLPGALLGRDPEYFWEALASCRKFQFCLGTRTSPQWPGSDYVMSCDAQLQGRMLTEISNRVYRVNGEAATESAGPEDGGAAPPARQATNPQVDGDVPEHAAIADSRSSEQRLVHSLFPEFNLLRGPDRKVTAESASDVWTKSQQRAIKLYESFLAEPSSALIALGSIKVNPLVEVMLARTFATDPFRTQDMVAKPKDRNCPILFRYREKEEDLWERDPQPASCCGGMQIAAKTPAPRAGIYYETETGRWEACGWAPASEDVAFLFYAYRTGNVQVEMACGGFSARATRCLTRKLAEITAQLGKPQFVSESLHVGLYLIAFSFNADDTNYTRHRDDREFDFHVIPLDEKVLLDRLQQKRTPPKRPAARTKKPRRKG